MKLIENNNKELTYNKTEPKNKFTFKQILNIIYLTLIGILIVFILFIIFIYNNDSNKLKRYLTKQDYICKNNICTKEIDGINYSINFKKGIYSASNREYRYELNNINHKLVLKEDNSECIFDKDNFTPSDYIDNTFTYSSHCKKYIEDVNKIIKNYNEIKEKSKVDVNSLKK